MSAILVDGRSRSGLQVGDRGLQYGDGLFETLAVVKGRAVLLEQHLQRLGEGCHRLGIPMPDHGQLHARILSLAAEPESVPAVIKLIVTRGCGGRGYAPPAEAQPTTIVTRHPFPDYPESYWHEGIGVRWCDMRLGRNPRLAGMKHLNRLEQVLARAEWTDSAIAEGIMRDSEGHVIEGVMSNLFVLKDDCLHTPLLDHCGVEGVMRQQVLKLAPELGWKTRIGALHPEDLASCDALLFSNSLIGLWPARRLDAREFDPRAFPTRLIARARAVARGEEEAR